MTTEPGHCYKAFEMIGDEWTLGIISTLRESAKRFCEIQRELNDLNPITLTNRLRKLEQLRLINRLPGSCGGHSVSYELTSLGQKALPIIDSIELFSKQLSL